MTTDTRPAIAPEAGRRYVLRNGMVTPPMSDHDDSDFPFTAAGHTWKESGHFLHSGNVDDHDIVAEHVDPADQSAEVARRDQGIAELTKALDEARARIAVMERQLFHERADFDHSTKMHCGQIEMMSASFMKSSKRISELEAELERVRGIAEARREIAKGEDARPTEEELAQCWTAGDNVYGRIMKMLKRCGLVREVQS